MKHILWIIVFIFVVSCNSTNQQRPQEPRYWKESANPNMTIYEVAHIYINPQTKEASLELHWVENPQIVINAFVRTYTGVFQQKPHTSIQDYKVEPMLLEDIVLDSHVVVFGSISESNPGNGNLDELIVLQKE